MTNVEQALTNRIADRFRQIDPTMKADVAKIEAEKFVVAFTLLTSFLMGLSEQ